MGSPVINGSLCHAIDRSPVKPPYEIGGLPQAYLPKADSSGTKPHLLNLDCSDANCAVLAAIIVIIITIIIGIASIMIGVFESIDDRLL